MQENPTAAELTALIESVNSGGVKSAATELGVEYQTVKNLLKRLYGRVGAKSRPHAVALLWPVIGEQLLPPRHDRRLGYQRRRG